MVLVLALFHLGLWNCGCARIYPNRFDMESLTRVCCFYSASFFSSHLFLRFVILGELNSTHLSCCMLRADSQYASKQGVGVHQLGIYILFYNGGFTPGMGGRKI